MLLSTLPQLPGRSFEVRGFVFAQATLGALGGGNTQKMVKSLIEQAAAFGADGIVDLRTVIGGENAHCVMTGTAVRVLPHPPPAEGPPTRLGLPTRPALPRRSRTSPPIKREWPWIGGRSTAVCP
ncbi:hypothetical protein [Phytohabitans rumicis]|uniref:hypothetical protein n=1 Tax=Phytohabitans rumicis TaxID=1076125 RepID=UPI0031EF778D